jgi:site-specific DNA recombinase
MKQCFGYVRVSTVKQGEGVSLEAQRDAILTFADRNNITITKWFEEKETAAKSGRPIFSEMLKALRRNAADGVVIHKIDRSARNFADWAKIGELADQGIDVHFASESLDFRSRGGRLSADIQAVIAADYIRNLKDEIRKGIDGRLKQGIYCFKAPIGYQDNGGGKPKTLDPVRAPLVKRVFQLYASGEHSYRSLLEEMERMGLRTDRNGIVSKGGLEAMLGNPFYTGIIRIKKTGAVYRGAHEALLSPSLFERVRQVRAGKTHKKITKHNHTLHGLFQCQHCCTAMIPELQKGHVYYRCHTQGCETKTVREERLEEAIEAVLARVEMSDEDLAFLTSEIEAWLAKRAEETPTHTYAMQFEQIEQRLEKLTDALIDRLIDNDAYNQRKQTLMLDRARLEERIESERQKRPDASQIRKFLELVKGLWLTYRLATKPEKRDIVQLATSNRTVAGKKIVVEPSDWLSIAQNAVGVLQCADDRPTSRSSPELRNQQVLDIIDAVKLKESSDTGAKNVRDQ